MNLHLKTQGKLRGWYPKEDKKMRDKHTRSVEKLALAELGDLGYTFERGGFFRDGYLAFHPVVTVDSSPNIDWHATVKEGLRRRGF